MKRNAAALVLCAAVMVVFAGCKEKTSADISYDVKDYVQLGEYEGIEVQLTKDYTVDQQLIDSTVESLIARTAPCVKDETQTVVAADSIVNVDYVGKKDGEAFDGGTASDVTLNVGTNSDVSTGSSYIEGFSSGLVGAKVGDTVDCPVTFPENYGSADLAGKQVVFTFTVNYIGTPVTKDTLTDAYVLENFQADSVADFLNTVEDYVNQTAKYSRENDIRSRVMDQVVANATVDKVPQEVLDLRVQEYTKQFEETYCTGDTTLEDYLELNYSMTVDQFTDQITDEIRENLVMELVFEAIAEKENIKFDQEGFDEFCDNLMTVNEFDSREKLYEAYAPTHKAGEKYLKKVYLSNKACDYCVEKASVKEAVKDAAEE